MKSGMRGPGHVAVLVAMGGFFLVRVFHRMRHHAVDPFHPDRALQQRVNVVGERRLGRKLKPKLIYRGL